NEPEAPTDHRQALSADGHRLASFSAPYTYRSVHRLPALPGSQDQNQNWTDSTGWLSRDHDRIEQLVCCRAAGRKRGNNLHECLRPTTGRRYQLAFPAVLRKRRVAATHNATTGLCARPSQTCYRRTPKRWN